MAKKEEQHQEQEIKENLVQELEDMSEQDLSEEYLTQLLSERSKNEELLARYTRLAADFDNFRKRTERQSRDLVDRANEDLINGLLPILDNFLLAMNSIQDEAVLKGIRMIYSQLMDVLESQGLSPMEAAGCPFDPVKHEAVAREESEEHEENIVLDEIRRGYMLGGKVLRPAMVKVNIKKEETT